MVQRNRPIQLVNREDEEHIGHSYCWGYVVLILVRLGIDIEVFGRVTLPWGENYFEIENVAVFGRGWEGRT